MQRTTPSGRRPDADARHGQTDRTRPFSSPDTGLLSNISSARARPMTPRGPVRPAQPLRRAPPLRNALPLPLKQSKGPAPACRAPAYPFQVRSPADRDRPAAFLFATLLFRRILRAFRSCGKNGAPFRLLLRSVGDASGLFRHEKRPAAFFRRRGRRSQKKRAAPPAVRTGPPALFPGLRQLPWSRRPL